MKLEDLIAGALGAIGGAVLFAFLFPFPAADGGSWVRGEALPGSADIFGWLLAVVAYAGFGFFSLVLAAVDVRTHTLPNGLIAWATLWTVPLLLVAGHFRGDGISALAALLSAGVATVFVFLLWFRMRGVVGGGDLKLIPVAAYAAVWGVAESVWVAGFLVFVLFLLAGVVVLVLVALILGRDKVAAGPLILAVSWITFVVTHMSDF